MNQYENTTIKVKKSQAMETQWAHIHSKYESVSFPLEPLIKFDEEKFFKYNASSDSLLK